MQYKVAVSYLMLVAICACSTSEATKEDECHKQAESRLALYNKPIYPITDLEKTNARNALFDECMRADAYQKEVDTRNALQPAEAPPPPPPAPPPKATENTLPPIVAAKTKPPLVPLWQLDIQPYTSPDKQLENILMKN